MKKKTLFKVLAGTGAALAGFGLVKLISGKGNEDENYEVVEDDGEYEEESEDIDETE